MIDPIANATHAAPTTHPQADLPGIPRGSSLNDILSGYGLLPSEAPGGLRRFRHELDCGDLRAIAEFWLTADGVVDAFRIWSVRPRMPRPGTTLTTA